MKNNKKIALGSLISTILIGVYMMFSLCAGIGSLFLVRYAGELTTVGMNLATNPGENGDYISGYLILPGSLTALLGGMTGVVAFLACCIIDISLNNLPVFPSNCVDFAQRCHRIASFSRLVDEKTFCVI